MRERLSIEKAQLELETARLEFEKMRTALELARSGMVSQKLQNSAHLVTLLVALSALATSWCSNNKTDKAYVATTSAVQTINETQHRQHAKVEDLRKYATALASASAVVPLPVAVAVAPRTSVEPPPTKIIVRVSATKEPPSPSPEPAWVDMPSPDSL